MGHTLRFFTYMWTTMPGSMDDCFGDLTSNFDPPKPKTFSEIFTRFTLKQTGINCGDLCFSGHQFFNTLQLLLIFKYSRLALRLRPALMYCFYFFVVVCWFAEGVFIISARNHYSIDVVISSYLTPLGFYWHSTYWAPKDRCPCRKGYIDYHKLEATKDSDRGE